MAGAAIFGGNLVFAGLSFGDPAVVAGIAAPRGVGMADPVVQPVGRAVWQLAQTVVVIGWVAERPVAMVPL